MFVLNNVYPQARNAIIRTLNHLWKGRNSHSRIFQCPDSPLTYPSEGFYMIWIDLVIYVIGKMSFLKSMEGSMKNKIVLLVTAIALTLLLGGCDFFDFSLHRFG